MDKQQAIAMSKSGWWENATAWEIAAFQLREDRLCMPFGDFHEAVEKALGRPVWTHEFAYCREDMIRELEGDKPAPTLEQIMDLIPAEKRIILHPQPDERGS